MSYQTKLSVYEQLPFNPSNVPHGLVWRRQAMRAWSEGKRAGIIPIVSDRVPDLGAGNCYSCAAQIGDEDSGDGKVGDNRWCAECFVALETTLT